MKRATWFVAMVITLMVSSPLQGEAKPAWCSTALQRCYEECQAAYSTDFYRTWCYSGCLLGYSMCGT